MSGRKTVCLDSLSARKQLLLIESELNRVEMGNELTQFENHVGDLVNEGKGFLNMAGTVVAGFKLARLFVMGQQEDKEPKKKSWMSSILKMVGMGAAIWGKFKNDKAN